MTNVKTVKLDLGGREPLSDQLTARLREAIASGAYRPGDVLPTIRELAKELGTSVKVPAEAMKRLAEEGLVKSRPRLGSVVQERDGMHWRGHILLVVPAGDYVYLNNMLTGGLRMSFSAAGYLVTQVSALRIKPGVPYDFGPLKLALRGSVTFAVSVFGNRETERVLSQSGIPFAVIGGNSVSRSAGCVGTIRVDVSAAVSEFTNHCLRLGVRHVAVVGKPDEKIFSTVRQLRNAGIDAEEFIVSIRTDLGRPEAVERGALESFAARLGRRDRLLEVLFFMDDWVCAGALTALLEAGVRIPDDVKIVTLSNKGLGPVFSRPFTRMEVDHELYSSVVSRTILAHLAGRQFPKGLTIAPKYIPGETF